MYMAKPFKMGGMRPTNQLRLFEGHFGWLDPAVLEGYPQAVEEILSKNPNIPEHRIATIVKQVAWNTELLSRFAE